MPTTSTIIRFGARHQRRKRSFTLWALSLLRREQDPFAELQALRRRSAAWATRPRAGRRLFQHRQFLVRYAGRTVALDMPARLQIVLAAGCGLCLLGVMGALGFATWGQYARTTMAREMENLRGTARLEAERAAAGREHLQRLGQELARSLSERDQAATKAFVTGKTLEEQKIDIDRLIGEREAVIDRALSERTRIAMERDQAIAERDEAIAERDAALAVNRDVLARLDQRTRNAIAEVEGIIASTGLDPSRMIKLPRTKVTGALPRGGPYIPWRPLSAPEVDPPSAALSLSSSSPLPRVEGANMGIDRLESLRDAIAHLPLASPVSQVVVSGGFGFRIDPFSGQAALHEGIDLRGPASSPIYATAAGMVTFAGWHYDYGNMVEIDHGFGLSTRYAHLGRILVKKGEPVALHQQLGLMGATGRVTAVHLHYEVRVDGRARNPINFLKADRYVPEAVHSVAAQTPAASGEQQPFDGFYYP